MRYLMIVITLFVLAGCGGNGSSGDQNPPASPQTHDSGKTPPAVPVID